MISLPTMFFKRVIKALTLELDGLFGISVRLGGLGLLFDLFKSADSNSVSLL